MLQTTSPTRSLLVTDGLKMFRMNKEYVLIVRRSLNMYLTQRDGMLEVLFIAEGLVTVLLRDNKFNTKRKGLKSNV